MLQSNARRCLILHQMYLGLFNPKWQVVYSLNQNRRDRRPFTKAGGLPCDGAVTFVKYGVLETLMLQNMVQLARGQSGDTWGQMCLIVRYCGFVIARR